MAYRTSLANLKTQSTGSGGALGGCRWPPRSRNSLPAQLRGLRPRSVITLRAMEYDDLFDFHFRSFSHFPSENLSTEDAQKILGVGPGWRFEQIMDVKNLLLVQAGSRTERVQEIEAAYDKLFMRAMERRLGGSCVSETVRFADVPSSQQEKCASDEPERERSVGLRAPKKEEFRHLLLVYSALAMWALLQAVSESPDAQLHDNASLQSALAVIYATYTFNHQKQISLGRSMALALALLILGISFGSGVDMWLNVDQSPVGPFSSPGVLSSEFGLLFCLLGSLFFI